VTLGGKGVTTSDGPCERAAGLAGPPDLRGRRHHCVGQREAARGAGTL